MQQGLDHELQGVLTDILALRKPDVRVWESIKARLSAKGILILDVHVPIEVGDVLTG